MGRHGTIAGRKAAQDNKRAAIFTKYARAIMVAAKAGADPSYNASLRTAIEKAKSISMPKDKIEQAVKKGSGQIEGESYEEARFEGYGPSGVAVIVDVLTDNMNRTTSAVKHIFDRFGGNMGAPGCVSYMFERKGVILVEKSLADEDALMEAGLDAGLEDVLDSEEYWEVRTEPDDLIAVVDALAAAGIENEEADVEFIPSIEAAPKDDHALKSLSKMVDAFDENDDVQKVYNNSSVELVYEY
ncbi:MAG: YebC/PmpR family DNA-binding transcriptional regulator [Clostridiales Family XIII bacterium]|jgi:YebC/PmpR family DNA-binding regulatory protein|nr:YebC/PmpR family DNA-binding transcriptional regulator [Clostridiales Family XIII bacterium]